MATVTAISTKGSGGGKATLDYVGRDDKTENGRWVTALGCTLPTAYDEFKNTKKLSKAQRQQELMAPAEAVDRRYRFSLRIIIHNHYLFMQRIAADLFRQLITFSRSYCVPLPSFPWLWRA